MRHAAALSLLLAVALPAGTAHAADWPHWRGPQRNGVSAESSGWPDRWPPKRLWDRDVGLGCTSPIIARGRLYVMGWEGNPRGNPIGTDVVQCLDARTGKPVWRRSYRARYQSRLRTGDTGQYGGPSSTPSYDADTGYLYTVGVDGDLRCWNAAEGGKPIWSKNLYDTYKIAQRPDVGGGRRDFGFTSSPLVLGDSLILEVGAATATVVAFDKRTGKQQWVSAFKGTAGHTGGPVPITVQGTPCLANLGLDRLAVMRLDKGHEGQTVAEYKWQTHYGCNIATPAVAGSRLVLTASYNVNRTEMLEVSLGGIRRLWSVKENALMSCPVAYKSRIFLPTGGTLVALDAADGRRAWRGGNFGHGSCIVTAGDDRLIVFGRGRLAVLDALAAGQGYKELGHLEGVVHGTCYPYLALSDGVLACKDRKGDLACLAVGAPE